MTHHPRRIPRSTVLVSLLWTILAAALAAWALATATPAAAVFCVAVPFLWITGLRAAALWMRAAAQVSRAAAQVSPAGGANRPADELRVALLYCVADDADPAAISASAAQDRAVDVVVLDDSRHPAVTRRLAEAAASHGWIVIRRRDRTGFKAGNLNHGLAALRGRYDAYVLCDSDVVLPSAFVRRALPALVADPTVAVVQAQPVARRGGTWFTQYFGPLLRTHLSITRAGRQAVGLVALLGRGAVVRAAALDGVGGVPEVVAEDLALTVALRRHGWRLVNVDVEFHEDYPIDYRSFRTQMRKTAEGAVEFLRRPRQLRGLPLRERGELVLETALIPLTALAGIAALVSGAVLASLGTPPPLWALVAAGASALAPLVPEAMRRARAQRPAAGLAFLALGGALYASTMFVVLAAVVRTALGDRAVFRITPKHAAPAGWRHMTETLRAELVLVPLLMATAALAAGSPLFASAPIGPFLAAVAFALPAAAGRASRRAEPPHAPARLLRSVSAHSDAAVLAAGRRRIEGVVQRGRGRPAGAGTGVGARA